MTNPFPKLTDQAWSFLFVATGCVMAVTCYKHGWAAEIGSGIVGAGINAFTSTVKQQQNVDHANTVNQMTLPEKKV